MKKILVIALYAIAINTSAQVKQIKLQASGLTCSMCSRAIYKALEKLSLTDSITSNIKESSYTMDLKRDVSIDFDAIRKAVEDAGFSVAKMDVKAIFETVHIQNDEHVVLAGKILHFLDVKEQTLNGEQIFQIVDKDFVHPKIFKKYAATTKMECVKTGVMKSCCSNPAAALGKRIYHVTLKSIG